MRKLSILALCLLPVTAAAQSSENQTIEEIRKNAKIHVGPFYLSPGIELKELGVDTNIFNEQEEPRSDFMFNLSPKVDVGIPFTRRALLTTAVGTDLVWYAKYKSERAVNPQLKARGELFLHRLTLFAENSFANAKQRANNEIDLRARYLDNTFSAGAGYRITPKFSLEAFGRRSLVEFDSDAVFLGTRLQDTLNRNTVGYGLVARHKLTPLTTLVLLTEQSNDKFPFSPLRDSRSVRILPGVEFKPRALEKALRPWPSRARCLPSTCTATSHSGPVSISTSWCRQRTSNGPSGCSPPRGILRVRWADEADGGASGKGRGPFTGPTAPRSICTGACCPRISRRVPAWTAGRFPTRSPSAA